MDCIKEHDGSHSISREWALTRAVWWQNMAERMRTYHWASDCIVPFFAGCIRVPRSKDKIIKISRPVSSIVGLPRMPSGSQEQIYTTQNKSEPGNHDALCCWMFFLWCLPFSLDILFTRHLHFFWLVQIKSSLPTVFLKGTLRPKFNSVGAHHWAAPHWRQWWRLGGAWCNCGRKERCGWGWQGRKGWIMLDYFCPHIAILNGRRKKNCVQMDRPILGPSRKRPVQAGSMWRWGAFFVVAVQGSFLRARKLSLSGVTFISLQGQH